MSAPSLRHSALVWMTALLAAVGLAAMAIAFVLSRNEADEFLDNQLRQVALNAGLIITDADAPAAGDPDPDDQVAVAIWQGDRIVRDDLRQAAGEVASLSGFTDVTLNGEAWRACTIRRRDWTIQAAQR